MPRPLSPNEPIAEGNGMPTRPFSAWLREHVRENDGSAALVDALLAHLIAEGVIAPDWRG